jgi:hypothetical protein
LVKQRKCFNRIRKSFAHVEAMIEHFEDDSMFPIRYSSSKGAIRFRALSIRASFRAVCEACRRIGCEELRWEDYLDVLNSSDYTKQVHQNCVCT